MEGEAHSRPCSESWPPCPRSSCRSSRKVYSATLTTITSTFIQVAHKQPSKLLLLFFFCFIDTRETLKYRGKTSEKKTEIPSKRERRFLLARRETIVTFSIEILFRPRVSATRDICYIGDDGNRITRINPVPVYLADGAVNVAIAAVTYACAPVTNLLTDISLGRLTDCIWNKLGRNEGKPMRSKQTASRNDRGNYKLDIIP